ncbi:M81 family metallopeptidase [Thioalkalivibrio sp. HK1]|uniref:M81 family metallopeptidase n=1 Tax=Thioalkalivibrio sp. HK1 TaxID=1469245 RepID=UPI000471C120|nr:M81 family metallopeptidase [Thioalkalivibrio sp. HK1]
MKTFIACLGTETNSFSNLPTGMQTFLDSMYFEGDATRHPPNLFSLPLHIWRRKTEERQGEVVESIAAFAQPAGLTVRSVYEGLRDRILADLRAASPVDIVLLSLHGAMTAEGYDDCEGDLMRKVRDIVGPDVVLGVELDLHCSITPAMTEAADVMVLFKEYPHTDVGPRAEELFDICARVHAGEVNPVIAVHDCKMIMKWRTPTEPMKTIVSQMQDAEGQGDILSVSFAHGFPWQDVPCTSGKMVVVANANAQAAAETAKRFAQRLWSVRDEANQSMISTDQALDLIEAGPGPVVIADVADNAGGGAPSDSTFVLRAALDRGIAGLMTGHYWDPIAVRFCQEAGEGASIDLRIGGKCGVSSGDPVDLRVRVKRILEEAGQTFGDARMPMGTAVWVTTGDIDLILTTKRTQVFHPDGMTQLGVDPTAYRGIVVKSTQHFYAGFAPIASRIEYLSGPGAIPPDFATIPYRHFGDDYWPKVQDPFNEG